MNRILLSLLFILQSSTVLWAQNENSVLWEIENGEKPSYVLGIFCNTCINDVLSTTPLDFILPKIDLCVFEYPYTDPLFNLKTAKSLFNEHFEEYNKVFNKKQFRMLNRVVKANNEVTLYKYDEFAPWVTLEILKSKKNQTNYSQNIVSYVVNKVGQTASLKDFNDWKLNFSIAKNKTINEQFEDFENFKKSKKSRKEKNKVNKILYREGKIDELEQNCNCLEQIKLASYADNWIPKMKEYLKNTNESFLFVLPAYSLGKSTGILQLLRKNDFVIKPL